MNDLGQALKSPTFAADDHQRAKIRASADDAPHRNYSSARGLPQNDGGFCPNHFVDDIVC